MFFFTGFIHFSFM